MGIGNTTSASAITCLLTGALPDRATGRGTGLDAKAHDHKIKVVEALLMKHFGSSADPSPFDVLRCIGGLEIAAMVGMVLGAASRRLIIVIDGFISTAAAALAVAISPAIQGYLIAGHRSEEPGHTLLLDHLKLTPLLSLGMRLGEGTGAALAMPILESAIALYSQMGDVQVGGGERSILSLVAQLRGTWSDFLSAVQFLTRIPLPSRPYEPESLARSLKYFPLVGLIIGGGRGTLASVARASSSQVCSRVPCPPLSRVGHGWVT